MPERYDPCSEQIMEAELLTVKHLTHFDFSSAPTGPMKEERSEDSSELKMHKAGEEDEIAETQVTHGQKFEFSNGRSLRRRITLFPNVTVTAEEGDHSFRHGAKSTSGQPDSRR
jgi:hypothetical protein